MESRDKEALEQMSYPEPFSFEGLNTYSLFDRPSKVTTADFASPLKAGMSVRQLLKALPGQLAAADLLEIARLTAAAVEAGRPVVMAMGAHVIKVGLNPVIIDLMERGIITAIAMNGAGIIHDSEIAMAGKTSEDVAAVLGQGAFGAARETGQFLNACIKRAAESGMGLGRSVGTMLLESDFPYNGQSLLASAARLEVPVTVHVAIGTDIIHIHPDARGEEIGAASFRDFQIFCSVVKGLEAGVYFNVGSAVLLPEVFLKALTAVRNLGHQVKRFTTVNLDFIRQYRPLTNVVSRPTLEGGKGFSITGHHELMIPLLFSAVLEELEPKQQAGP